MTMIDTLFLRRMLAFVVCILILRPLKAQEIRWSYDVNGDGSVNSTDVAVLTHALFTNDMGAKYVLVSGSERYACDVNNDNVVNSTDITLVSNAIFGNIKGEQLNICSITIPISGDASNNKDNDGNLPPLDVKKQSFR